MNKLSIAIVTYCTDINMLRGTLLSIKSALKKSNVSYTIRIVDHSLKDSDEKVGYLDELESEFGVKILYKQDNPGFGCGHNSIFSDVKSEYHIIVNPDIEVDPSAISNALSFMDNNKDCGLLTPYATWGNGDVQYLCKRYPSVFDLFIRGFTSGFIKDFFRSRISRYEMADSLNDHDVYWDPEIVSGCFMFFRSEVFMQLHGFDSQYFLYFEDFDISLRTGKISRIAYVPQVKIVHHGGHASRKGWRHIKMFGRSMITFFNIHGWRWW